MSRRQTFLGVLFMAEILSAALSAIHLLVYLLWLLLLLKASAVLMFELLYFIVNPCGDE